jgi:hypothetical protein
MRKTIFLFACVLGLSIIIGCNGDKIQNQWADREIAIDGKYADWEGIPQNINNGERIALLEMLLLVKNVEIKPVEIWKYIIKNLFGHYWRKLKIICLYSVYSKEQ